MGGTIIIDRKAVVRLLLDLVHGPFETILVGLDASELRIRALDGSRTIVMDATLPNKSAKEVQPDSREPVAVLASELRDFLNGIIGHFEDENSSLKIRVKEDELGLLFRREPATVRATALRNVPDAIFAMPRFSGLAKAAKCHLAEPESFSMTASTFGERSPELTVEIESDKFVVRSSASNFLALPGKGTGRARTRLHRSIFETTSTLCASGRPLASINVAVVSEGVAEFTFALGEGACATYVVAPLAGED